MEEVKNASVDGKIMDVISEEKFLSNYGTYNNPMISSTTAVEVEKEGTKYILPLRTNQDEPGIFVDGSVYFINATKEYESEKFDVVDFANTDSIQDFLNKNSQIRQMEANILTDADSIFAPPPDPNDKPEMIALKDAICSKQIDINKYAQRFGPNFLNDKRIFKSNSITLNKMESLCNNFDIEISLTLRDKSPDVPNPMGKEITVVLTGDVEDE